MRLLIDNDVVHKLAAFDLLPAALDCFGGTTREDRLTPQARFSMCVRKNRDKGVRRWGAEVHGRIVRFVEATAAIEDAAAAQDLAALASVPDIDHGEKLLYAIAARDEASLVVTGDHRSVAALAQAPSCVDIVESLEGRVVVVEHLVLAACAGLGFAAVKARIVVGVAVDTGIHAWAFGSGTEADEAAALQGLRNRVRSLRDRTGTLVRSLDP